MKKIIVKSKGINFRVLLRNADNLKIKDLRKLDADYKKIARKAKS